MLCLPETQTWEKVKQTGLDYQVLNLNSTNPLELGLVYQRLKKILACFQPDVVNCHRGEGFIFLGLLARKFGFKLIRTRGDQRLPKKNVFNLWLHQKVASAVIATNSRMYNYFLTSFGLDPAKVHLVLGGIDRREFYPCLAERNRIRKKLGYSDTDVVLGLLGRFDRVKGQKELIQAVSQLYHQCGLTQLRLLLIGFDTALSTGQIQDWLRQYRVEHLSTITGRVEHPRPFINSLDLGVVASLSSEAIIRAGLEIMACQVPLIATKVGVLPDLVPESGLVLPGDVEALASKIKQALDPEFRRSLLEQEQALLPELSLENFVAKTLKIYGAG